MDEGQGSGVEALAFLPQLRLFMAVDGIAQNGVTDVGHVDADLMVFRKLRMQKYVVQVISVKRY